MTNITNTTTLTSNSPNLQQTPYRQTVPLTALLQTGDTLTHTTSFSGPVNCTSYLHFTNITPSQVSNRPIYSTNNGTRRLNCVATQNSLVQGGGYTQIHISNGVRIYTLVESHRSRATQTSLVSGVGFESGRLTNHLPQLLSTPVRSVWPTESKIQFLSTPVQNIKPNYGYTLSPGASVHNTWLSDGKTQLSRTPVHKTSPNDNTHRSPPLSCDKATNSDLTVVSSVNQQDKPPKAGMNIPIYCKKHKMWKQIGSHCPQDKGAPFEEEKEQKDDGDDSLPCKRLKQDHNVQVEGSATCLGTGDSVNNDADDLKKGEFC